MREEMMRIQGPAWSPVFCTGKEMRLQAWKPARLQACKPSCLLDQGANVSARVLWVRDGMAVRRRVRYWQAWQAWSGASSAMS